MAKLVRACNVAKHELTTARETTVAVDNIMSNNDLEIEITLAKFNEICEPIFQRCIPPLAQALKDARLTKDKVDEIIIVGGSTRIPRIQEILTEFFDGKKINKTLQADQTVAYGATI